MRVAVLHPGRPIQVEHWPAPFSTWDFFDGPNAGVTQFRSGNDVLSAVCDDEAFRKCLQFNFVAPSGSPILGPVVWSAWCGETDRQRDLLDSEIDFLFNMFGRTQDEAVSCRSRKPLTPEVATGLFGHSPANFLQAREAARKAAWG